jgi:uncharacterized membrane protein
MENSQYSSSSPYGPSTTTDSGKTAAIVSYITIIGWLISYFALYKDSKTQLASYHLRQTLLLYIIGIGWSFISSALFFSMPGIYFITMLVNIGLFVLWLLGLISAVNGQTKPMPLIGEPAQRVFSGI